MRYVEGVIEIDETVEENLVVDAKDSQSCEEYQTQTPYRMWMGSWGVHGVDLVVEMGSICQRMDDSSRCGSVCAAVAAG
jgi:hypothetical protein